MVDTLLLLFLFGGVDVSISIGVCLLGLLAPGQALNVMIFCGALAPKINLVVGDGFGL